MLLYCAKCVNLLHELLLKLKNMYNNFIVSFYCKHNFIYSYSGLVPDPTV